MGENLTIEERESNLPWYLKRGWSTFFAFICAPVAQIILLFHLNNVGKQTRWTVFLVAIFGGLWLLNFVPAIHLQFSLRWYFSGLQHYFYL
ncbi:hypothetical protein AEA09_12755 [Lysinibacillus contaminans]|uniref:Histidine kinase n=1 Tax=Lysinibacillus contaminans TaxID=1293441 RepID=A0ABR5K4S1_9BACI|nr:hypothetical protein [Lysinibacillus contaminans]KOS69344.1 hypothetical protein AEA09_12755 [Lysinibacillus contaminans]